MNKKYLQPLLSEIESVLESGAWQVSLMSALAIPDICASIESDNRKTTGDKYQKWVERWMGNEYPMLNGADLWQMRCSMLHQGISNSKSYERIVFAASGSGLILHKNIMNNALNLHLPFFVNDLLLAAKNWEDALHETPTYERNIETLVRWYPDGLSPYVLGAPVLA